MHLILNLGLKALSSMLLITVIGGGALMAQTQQSDESAKVMIDFTQAEERNNWVIVNDTVMGGRSRTVLAIQEGKLFFSGNLSLENNGGFASIRRVYDTKSWVNNRPLSISVEGDGREYQIRLRTNRRMDGVAYVATFKTTESGAKVFSFAASDFVPQFRGRLVSGAPDLAFSDVEQVGFMLADKQAGEFTLLVDYISQ